MVKKVQGEGKTELWLNPLSNQRGLAKQARSIASLICSQLSSRIIKKTLKQD